MGAGRTELVRAITGADPIAGPVRAAWQARHTPSSPIDAIRNGIVLVPEDRKLQGVVLDHTIGENIAYANFGMSRTNGWIIVTARRSSSPTNTSGSSA